MSKIFGATLLIAGCCIGAGMLGIPVMTGPAGFIPSTYLFVFAWAFMVLCGFVLVEVVLSFNRPHVNLLTMTQETLGKTGRFVASFCFMFLFYAIMMAYIIASAVLISSFSERFFGLPIPFLPASTLFVGIMYAIIARGVRLVDGFNRALMLGLIVCYGLLVCFGIPAVESENLQRQDWSLALVSLPILVISFGFHNLIPTLATYLDRQPGALKLAITIGSLIPLGAYLLWEYVILGLVPASSLSEWIAAQNSGELVTQVLADQVVGDASFSLLVRDLANGFGLFAIATSFLPVSFSFLDFLRDGARQKGFDPSTPMLAAAVILPPWIVSLIDSHLFLQALNYAGGFCAVILFGILPCLMAWKRQNIAHYQPYFVASKKSLLLYLLLISCFIMYIQLQSAL